MQPRQSRRMRPLWGALILMAASLSPAVAQDSPATVVVVFDGSNSMNGRIPGDTANAKHVLVREALRGQLPKIAGTRVGLAAFGHRRASDCTDAAMIVAPSPDTQPLMAELERFRPRGFSPVALALREAASALADTPGSVGVLLVLDDLASCRAEDPCAVGSDLVAKNPRLTISALGLALNPAAAERMTCLATTGKGRFVNVPDARELEAAMESVLASTVKLTPPAPVPAKPGVARAKPPAAVAELPVPASPGLYLSLRLSAQGPLLDRPAYWRVMREGDATDASPAEELEQASGMLELAPGRYRVDVSVAGIERSSTVEVVANQPTQLSVALDAGLVNVAVRMSKGGPPAAGALITAVPANDSVGPSRTSLVARIAEDGLLLPAGTWRIVGELGLARSERTVTIKAGERLDVDLSLDAGRLSLSADPPGSGLRYTVSEDDPDSPEGRQEVARSAAAAPSFVLPAGAYNLSVRRGSAETRERVRLQPGDDIRRRISLGSARIRITSRLPGTAGGGAPPVSTRVIRLDGIDREIARSSEPEAVFQLAPGRYRVEARLGGQNAVARRDVEVRGDAEQRIVLDHAAGTVQLRVAGTQSSLQFGEVFWTILDQAGLVIWQTGQSEPVIVLSAGRYVARVEARGSQYERTFDVRVGDATRLELGG